jgi:hypothetical protein
VFSQVTRLTNSKVRKMLLKGKSMCPEAAKVPVPVMELLFHRNISYGQIENFAVEWVALQCRLREIPV